MTPLIFNEGEPVTAIVCPYCHIHHIQHLQNGVRFNFMRRGTDGVGWVHDFHRNYACGSVEEFVTHFSAVATHYAWKIHNKSEVCPAVLRELTAGFAEQVIERRRS